MGLGDAPDAGQAEAGATVVARHHSAILIGALADLLPAVRASRMPPTVPLQTV